MLVASNAETGGWRAGDAPHAAGEEITVDQLKPEYLHCRPKALRARLLLPEDDYYCMRNLILHSVNQFVRLLYQIPFFSRRARGLLHGYGSGYLERHKCPGPTILRRT